MKTNTTFVLNDDDLLESVRHLLVVQGVPAAHTLLLGTKVESVERVMNKEGFALLITTTNH